MSHDLLHFSSPIILESSLMDFLLKNNLSFVFGEEGRRGLQLDLNHCSLNVQWTLNAQIEDIELPDCIFVFSFCMVS